jgi:RNA polymerase sigma factor (sigma-70 family)
MQSDEPICVDAYTTLIVAAYQRYRSFWINLGRTAKLPTEDAEDILHAIMGSLLGRRDVNFESIAHVRNYVARAMLNRAGQAYQRGQRVCEFDESASGMPELPIDMGGLEQKEERETLKHILQSLSEQDYQIVKLRFFSGLTFIEISQILGAPVSTLKSREDAALKRIRRSFAERGL